MDLEQLEQITHREDVPSDVKDIFQKFILKTPTLQDDSSQQYRNVLDSLGDFIHVIDKDMRFILQNPSMEQLLKSLNLNPIQPSKTFQEVFPFSERSIIEEYNQVFLTGETLVTEEDININGRNFFTEVRKIPIIRHGKVIQIITVIRDITQRKQAEGGLKESEAKFRTLFESSPVAIGIADIRGRVIDCNQRMLNLTAYNSLEELQSTLLRNTYVNPYDRDILIENLRQSGQVQDYEVHLLRKDGTDYYAMLNIETVKLEGKKLFITTQSDITERKRAEKARIELEQQRDRFISMTSHELRTPLTIISGYTEFLENKIDELQQDNRKQVFQGIRKNIERLENLIKGVSGINQVMQEIFQINKQDLDFCRFIADAVQPYKELLSTQFVFNSSHQNAPVMIKGDPEKLQQIVDNLIGNAVKNTPKNQRKINVGIEVLQNHVRTTVTDNGAGIDPENFELIFEQFFSVETEYSVKGTGIGLFLSREIAHAHGGTLTAQSKGKGHGATFILDLPRKIQD